MNGIDTTALTDFATAVTADPKAGEARFAVDTHWQGGTRSRAQVGSLRLGGQEHARRFTIDADEPPSLLGDDTAPNPQELLLAALNACVTVGIAATAALHGVTLSALRIRTNGTLDLRGFLGLDPGVNPGYDVVDMRIDVTSPAADSDVRAVIDAALLASPNLNNFRRAINVTPTITTSTDA
ncbi:OsmC family protein [Streptosporangium sp. NPDC051023]|uniref:OsmC family protein n=1 Tax=Streptosporangium sp. NPDC051023 TaxID=3155410 RepID=UPI00344DF20D